MLKNQSWLLHHANVSAHMSLLVHNFLAKNKTNHASATEFTRLGPLRLFPVSKTEETHESMEICYDWGDKTASLEELKTIPKSAHQKRSQKNVDAFKKGKHMIKEAFWPHEVFINWEKFLIYPVISFLSVSTHFQTYWRLMMIGNRKMYDTLLLYRCSERVPLHMVLLSSNS